MLRGLLIAILLLLNLMLWGTLVLLGGIVKLVALGRARRRVILALTWFGERWVRWNDAMFDFFLSTRWTIEGLDDVRPDKHYLVISNHVSWVDIFAAFRAIRGRGPFLRFFLKSNLIWFPIVGQAAWALDFPFMKRYTAAYLKDHPEKRGRDLETTRIACRRYRQIPVTILNYVEGTRFSREKHAEQASPYRNLLRPRIGGIGFVLASFAEQIDAVYDLTLVYPNRDVTMWDFVRNRVPWIRVHARRIAVPAEFRDAAITEQGPVRDRFKVWVDQLWREKDELIERILLEART